MVNINPMQEHHGDGDNVAQNKYVYYIQEDGSKKGYLRYLNNIPRPTEKVIGRGDQLTVIREQLAEDNAPILMNGIGGIGKTTLAMAYIEQHGGDYQHIAWVKVTDRIASAFVTSLVLIKRLHLERDLERIPAEVREAQGFELIINTLSNLDNCLLVIDNANDAEDLRACAHLLRSLRATTLLTSRAHPKGWNVYPIHQLKPADAALLFMDHFAAGVQPEQMDMLYALLTCIDHHTLLIELLAKAATEMDLSLAELYDKVQANYIHDADINTLPIHTGAHADHTELPTEKRVANYIRMVFQQMSDLNPTEQRYLRYLCLLPSDYYDKNFLMEVFQITADTKAEYLQTMDALAVAGWLSQERDERGKVHKLHSVIQDVAIQELGISYERCAPVVDYWNDALYIDQTKDNPVEKFPLLPYGVYIIEKLEVEHHEKIVDLLDNVGRVKWHLGKYHPAASLMEKALTMARSIFGDKHATVARLQSHLANVYSNLGEYARARDLLELALANAIQNFGEAYPNVAVRQSNLATVYADLGEYARARDLLELALASNIQNFGEAHPTVAVSQSNLANVYQDLGEYARARDLLETALANAIQNFGEAHPTVAVNQSNLANVYSNLREYVRARDLLEAALANAIQNFGEAHPTVAVHQSNLANVYRNLREYARARDLLELALANAIQHFGEAHPNVAVHQSNLATVYQNLGEYVRARDLLELALANAIQHFGEAHPNVAIYYNNLIEIYAHFKQWEKAQEASDKSLTIWLTALGADHPYTKIAEKKRAWLQAQFDQSDGA